MVSASFLEELVHGRESCLVAFGALTPKAATRYVSAGRKGRGSR